MKVTVDLTDEEVAAVRRWRLDIVLQEPLEARPPRVRSFVKLADALPRPIAVGDRVGLPWSETPGRVLGVDGRDAWVRWDNGLASVVLAGNLIPIEGGAS